jgi:hypothetical protein
VFAFLTVQFTRAGLRPLFGHGRTVADLMNANDPIRSDQLQHDPHFIPNSRLQRPGGPIALHLLDVLICRIWAFR